MGDSTDYDATVVGGPEGVSEALDAPLYLSPGNYGVSGEGGADIGAINADADVSEPVQWTNSGEFTEVPRGNEVTFTWTGPGAARVIVAGVSGRQAQQRFGDVSVSSPGGLVQLPCAHCRAGQSSGLPLDSWPVGWLSHPRVMAHGHTRGLHCRRSRSSRRDVPVGSFQNGPIPLGGECPVKGTEQIGIKMYAFRPKKATVYPRAVVHWLRTVHERTGCPREDVPRPDREGF